MNNYERISNINNINVSSNEYLTKYSIWRNIKKLLQNDEKLTELYNNILINAYIDMYVDGTVYNANDMVWFLNEKKMCLVLLRSNIDTNSNAPNKDGLSYEENGWKNLSEDVNIDDLNIFRDIQNIEKQIITEHEAKHHKNGDLSYENTTTYLLKNDFSNRNIDRPTYQFPYTTGFFSDDVILRGFYRYYDCGLIEYDIIFRFGYSNTYMEDGEEKIELMCNNVKFENIYNNDSYFLDEKSYSIFYNTNFESNKSIIGNTVQKNRNNFCNVYFADIKFPKTFINTKYMVFCGGIPYITHNGTDGEVNKNNIVFANKNEKSITAMLITYPNNVYINENNDEVKKGGLLTNSFRCKIVGKVVRI